MPADLRTGQLHCRARLLLQGQGAHPLHGRAQLPHDCGLALCDEELTAHLLEVLNAPACGPEYEVHAPSACQLAAAKWSCQMRCNA